MANRLRKALKWWLRGSSTELRTCAYGTSSPRTLRNKWAQTKFPTRMRGGGNEYASDWQRLGGCGINRVRHHFNDGCAGKDVPQGGAARSVDCLRISRDTHRAGERHDYFSDGGELPRALA